MARHSALLARHTRHKGSASRLQGRPVALCLSAALLVTLIPLVRPSAITHAATTWYVATTGSDTNDCLSAATACQHIQTAINRAASGDSLTVAAGAYTELLTIGISLTINGSSTGSTIINGAFSGAVLNVTAGGVTINNLILHNGKTIRADGGGIVNSATLTVTNSTITGNSAMDGGGILNNGTLVITNSTISNNSASAIPDKTGTEYYGGDGGGILNNGSLVLLDTTISANSASSFGPRAAIYGGGIATLSGAVSMRNTILAGNTSTGSGPDCEGTLSSQGYNLLGNDNGSDCTMTAATGDLIGTSSSPINPQLGPVHNNFGPTWTMALLAGSPAIDAGSCTDAHGNTIITDQRGYPRPYPVGGKCEIGAFEYGYALPTPLPTYTATPSATATSTPTATDTPSATPTVPTSTATPIRPTNDDFDNATLISSVPYTRTSEDTTTASVEAGEPLNCPFTSAPMTATVWFRYTPPAAEQLTVTTAGSNYDTVLAAYTGSSVGSLQPVACNDDAPGLGRQSAITLTVQAGIQYSFQVGSYRNAAGGYVPGTLTLSAIISGPAPTDTPTNTPTDTPTDLPTDISTASSTSTSTPTPTQTPGPTNTPTSTQTPAPTSTPTLTQAPTPSITATPTSIATTTNTATATPFSTATATSTPPALLTVNPPGGSFQTTMTITGTGFGAGEPINITWDTITSTFPLSTTTTPAGIFVTTASVPQATVGSHILLARGLSSGRSASTPFQIAPRVMLLHYQGASGTLNQMQGTGFAAHESVTGYWKAPGGVGSIMLGTTTTNNLGSFSGSAGITFTVPLSPTGTYNIYGIGGVSKRSPWATFAITGTTTAQ